ncbi:MAG: ATP synthase F1 subunit delta [Acetobacteraceae bacterium]|nr:ATP synthase F1 subunit delta [Acetobacteraceae bacterium]
MLRLSIARRYATALFLLARERGREEEVRSELLRLLSFVEACPDLGRFLQHRLIPPSAKAEALRRCLSGALMGEVLDFLHMLVTKRREGYLQAIVAEYGRLADLAQGVLQVQVRSAVTIPEKLQDGLRRKLEAVSGRRVKLELAQDPGLLGGLVVQVGDRVFDSSLRTHLRGFG